MLRKVKKSMPIVLLFLIWLFLVYSNFSPNTFLSGWDNLHPEFNFLVNIKRSLFASWQEYQGLGLNGGMAHAADFPRQLVLWLSSFVLPLGMLRYFWTFSMLLVGSLGAYFLIHFLTLNKKLPAFVGALFYLFNLATLQYFYLPFETFISFFGFFPWLLFLGLKYLEQGKKRNLIIFSIVSFLASCAFYVQTLFIVYVISFSILSLGFIAKNKKSGIKRFVVLALLVSTINAYWLLPVIYFALSNPEVVSFSHQNSIATPETRYFNEARRSFFDLISLKGFWFDYKDINESGVFDIVMGNWTQYVKTIQFKISSVILFVFSIAGILGSLAKKKLLARFPILLLFIVVFLMLLGVSLPNPLFSEAFRSPFTKWSVVMGLMYAVGIGYLINLFISTKKKSIKIAGYLVATISVVAMAVSMKPIFSGDLFYKNVKVELPSEYLEVFEYFGKLPKESRIAQFPISSPWGWQFNDWGYRGSGFNWYGIEQPILSRSFDVWSDLNETFYNEASYSLYKKDLEGFEKVLEKYQVKYLLLDESIVNAGGKDDVLYVSETKTLLNASSKVREVQKIGFIIIYETNFDVGEKSVWSPDTFRLVDANLTYSQTDSIYSSHLAYVQDKEGITYPFANLDRRMGVEVEFSDKGVVLMSNVLEYSGVKRLDVPDKLNAKINNTTKKVEVNLNVEEKISETFESDRGFDSATNCDLQKLGSVTKEKLGRGVKYEAFDGGVSCDYYYYPQIDKSKGYILRIKGENVDGRGLKIYLFNPETKKMDLEELLPEDKFDEYFFILPNNVISNTEEIDAGYTLNVETRSFGKVSSENIIENIEIVEFPYNLISKIKLESENNKILTSNLTIKNIEKKGTTNYKVNVSGDGLLVLGQGYEEGWIATINGQKLKHVKVNSWQNGWIIPNGENEISIFFWPQYLEWGGFVLLIVVLIFIKKKGGVKK